MAEYYVVRDKNTGLYFRGKGVNRWGKYYNQASVYRVRANAENTIKEVSWRGEQAEVVPIQIIESTADVVPKSEFAKELIAEIAKGCTLKDSNNTNISIGYAMAMNDVLWHLTKIKQKYTEDINNESQNQT